MSFESLFPSMKTVYGVQPVKPSPGDMQLYRSVAGGGVVVLSGIDWLGWTHTHTYTGKCELCPFKWERS